MNFGRNNFRFVVFTFIRVLLLAIIGVSYYYQRYLVLLMASLGLIFTFVPWFLKFFFGIKTSSEVEILILVMIYGALLYGDLKGFYSDIWWWSFLLNFGQAIVLGLIGFTIISFMESEEMINTSYVIMSFLTFCFAFTLGGLWEIFEFSLYVLFGFGLQNGLEDTMKDLILNCIAGTIVSVIAYFNLKYRKKRYVSSLIFKLLRRNSKVFSSKKKLLNYAEVIMKLVSSGESDRLEFKATIRKNLHTGITDKKMEHSVLKTLVAYLNTNGGTLLIGVGDKGEVIGIEEEGFLSNDKLKLYFVNLIRSHLGNQYLEYIRFEVYPFNGKGILKVDCRKSDQRAFLKWEGEEEFYVRSGPSSVRLHGNEMVEYIERRFS